jgi:hypothetical protein
MLRGPFIDDAQRRRVEPIETLPALGAANDQVGVEQYPEMLRDGGDSYVEVLSQLLHGFFPIRKEVYQAPAVGVGDGVKDAVARGGMDGADDIKAFA